MSLQFGSFSLEGKLLIYSVGIISLVLVTGVFSKSHEVYHDGVHEQENHKYTNHLVHETSPCLLDGKAAAYVCENYVCKYPVTSPEDLLEQLNIRNRPVH
jgi:hypothetical protein